MKKLLKRLFLILFMLILGGAVFFATIGKKFMAPYRLSHEISVQIPKGAGLNQTAAILEKNGIITNARLFTLYARWMGYEKSLKAGEYEFAGSLSIESITQKLVTGDVKSHSLTIPEGKTLAEIKKIVENNPYLAGKITLALKEGEILPETYHFTRGENRNEILKKARHAMKNELETAFLNRDATIPINNKQELLILASIIEKETGLASERTKVASVFVNRLKLGMKLQTDPTVIYALTNGEMNLGRPLLKKDLSAQSPYNTYVITGLPPAPICSPGKAALYAAAHPETTKYLYFVADGITGGHRFAKTLSEHNHNVALYRKAVK